MWNKWIFIATAAALTGLMRASVGLLMTASLLRDMPDGKAVEAEAILGDLVRKRDSIDTPLLDIAYLHMKSYLARRNRTA